MVKQLPYEGFTVLTKLYKTVPVGNCYDSALSWELRGKTGLALNLYRYTLERFGPETTDTPYERMMGSIMYNAIARLSLEKEDYSAAMDALKMAWKLMPGNCETLFYNGEILFAQGHFNEAAAQFKRVCQEGYRDHFTPRSMDRLAQIESIISKQLAT